MLVLRGNTSSDPAGRVAGDPGLPVRNQNARVRPQVETLSLEKFGLHGGTETVLAKIAVGSDNPVTCHDDGNRVLAERRSDGP